MKQAFADYFIFSRRERYGITIVLSIVLILLSSSLWLPYCLPNPDLSLNERMNAAAMKLQTKQTASESIAATTPAALFVFDPNTLDSTGFIRLGLSTRTTHYLMNWRRKGKHFYHATDLKALYSLRDAEYQRLEPYINIAASDEQETYKPHRFEQLPPLPDVIDLNTTDSATLVRLDGVGRILAHKIIQRREALGGFIRAEQLQEVFHFPDTTFQYLKNKLHINASGIRKLNLNTCTESMLARHPYIGEQMAHNIVLLRSGLNKYEKIAQLRQVPLMNEEKYRKIAPYCIIE